MRQPRAQSYRNPKPVDYAVAQAHRIHRDVLALSRKVDIRTEAESIDRILVHVRQLEGRLEEIRFSVNQQPILPVLEEGLKRAFGKGR